MSRYNKTQAILTQALPKASVYPAADFMPDSDAEGVMVETEGGVGWVIRKDEDIGLDEWLVEEIDLGECSADVTSFSSYNEALGHVISAAFR